MSKFQNYRIVNQDGLYYIQIKKRFGWSYHRDVIMRVSIFIKVLYAIFILSNIIAYTLLIIESDNFLSIFLFTFLIFILFKSFMLLLSADIYKFYSYDSALREINELIDYENT